MDWAKPSKAHFRHIRSLRAMHLPSGLDFSLHAEGDALYLAFPGTADADDWASNLDFFPEPFGIYEGVKAHGGIARQYLSLREGLLDLLYSGGFRQVYVAGYSLGGALATAAVQDIGYHIDRDGLDASVFGVSYDGPRFFCPSRLVEKAVKRRLLTVKTRWDPVVHVPFKAMLVPLTFRWSPFKVKIARPRQWFSFWADVGEIRWIGKPWRIWPVQHNTDQIERALLKEYGE